MSETENDSQISSSAAAGSAQVKDRSAEQVAGQAAEQAAAQVRARTAVGSLAASLIQPGMVVGLGTGDTAAYFIRALGERVKGGLEGLRCVATSHRSAALALQLGMKVIDLDSLDLPSLAADSRPIDITVDGADEIDPGLQLIKGAGGALLFEKLVARASRELVIVADPAKLVKRIGEKRRLPVEVVRFGARHTLARLKGVSGVLAAELRMGADGPVVTDGGNYIIDAELAPTTAADLHTFHGQIKALPGVIETGLFLSEATRALIGDGSGHVEVISRKS